MAWIWLISLLSLLFVLFVGLWIKSKNQNFQLLTDEAINFIIPALKSNIVRKKN